MNIEYRDYILAVLNGCWDNSSEIFSGNVQDVELENILHFIKVNRIEGYFYRKLRDCKQNEAIFPYIERMYQNNLKDYEKILFSIKHVTECLKHCHEEYALVNGSFYIPFVCLPGERTQKDIDIWVSEAKYVQIDRTLTENGFKQSIMNERGEIREANRIEKMVARKNNSYVIPYHKYCVEEDIGDIWIDVDIIRLDGAVLSESIRIRSYNSDFDISCLDIETNIVCTCKTIYTKAKTYRYVKQRQDNVLHCFCELNELFHKDFAMISWEKIFRATARLNMRNAVYFTLTGLLKLFGQTYSRKQKEMFIKFINGLNITDTDFINSIYDEKNKKQYVYDCSFQDWIFCESRIEKLRGVEKEVEGSRHCREVVRDKCVY